MDLTTALTLKRHDMAQFEIDAKIIVEADTEEEAGTMMTMTLLNLEGGAILEAWVDSVTDLSMVP